MEQIYLRALQLTDLDRTWEWHNDAGLYETLVGPFRHVSKAAEEAWLRKKVEYSQTECHFAICVNGTDEHVGNIQLLGIDWIARHAGIGIFIGAEQHRSKGFGKQALALVARHAFDDLGLGRLWLTVLEDNARAIRAYERCGFVQEGRLRKHAFKKGHFKDVVMMGLCREDLVDHEAAR